MSDFSHETPAFFPKISRSLELFPKGSGVQYSKIPRKLWLLIDQGATSSTLLVAFAMMEHCSANEQYPTFELKRSKIAEKCGLSERQVTIAIDFLTSKNVLSVHYRHGHTNRYSWEDSFFATGENNSPVLVKDIQGGGENTSPVTGENISPIYIEFILYLFYRSYLKEFFDSNEQYSFYTPARRGKKRDDPEYGSSKIKVSRKEAWRDAVYHVYEQIKLEQNPLSRIYLALFGPYKMDTVRFPKKALFTRVHNWPALHESLSNSHLRQYLYNDCEFKLWIDEQRGLSESASQKLH